MNNNNNEHAVDIAELKTRVESQADTIQRHESRLNKHEEAIISLRENMAKVATRDDVSALRNTINTQFFDQLKQAHASIPAHIAAGASVGTVLLALGSFALAHFRG